MREYNPPDNRLRMKFGTRVRELRKKLNLSQEELGFKSNIHRTYIGAVERGEQNISLDNIGRIAKNLKVSLSELFKF
jgi:transcriptional regulator with XRE-family HTH domain